MKSSERAILAGATSFLNLIFNRDDFRQVCNPYVIAHKVPDIKETK